MDSTSPADDTAPQLPPETPLEAPPEITAPEPSVAAGFDAESATVYLPSGASDATSPKEQLTDLAARAAKGRLSGLEEEQAARAIKSCLLDGRAGVTTVIELLPKFAWMVAVNGVTAAWPELTVGFRTQLFTGLAKDESDAARRLRMSVARGLFKQDVPSALKIVIGVARELRDKETGELAQKDAQMFSNVFIGRAKPWVAALPLSELKPADADVLVNCAIFAAFSLPHPPVTQLGIIKWAAEAGRLAKLHPTALEAILKTVARWSAKWQTGLRREVSDLPEEITAVLKEPAPEVEERRSGESNTGEVPVAEESAAPIAEEAGEAEEQGTGEGIPAPARQYPVYIPRSATAREEPQTEQPPREPSPREQPRAPQPSREPSPRQSRRGGASQSTFNVTDALRQIEAHVAYLRGELKTAQNKLKERDEDRRPRRAERSTPVIVGEPTIEELARLNHQLETRIGELQLRITELTSDSEDRAASFGISSGEPLTDSDAGLRALLALKLQEDYADFLALEGGSMDIVVQAHYRTLLRHIFEVLTQEGVALKQPA